MPSTLAAVALAGALAAVHVLAGRLRFLGDVPRSRWLSAGGGVSVAYVFVHLLPEIAEHQADLGERGGVAGAVHGLTSEQPLFVAAMIGFALFYGLEQLAARSHREQPGEAVAGGAETATSAGVFWLHVGSFAAYNALVGYLLLHREATGAPGLLLYAVAMGLHFVVNDAGLREHHRAAYHAVGRWLLAGAVLAGVALAHAASLPEPLLGLLLSFLAGGVVLNVIKEELPAERESSFPAFAAGLAVYTAVLLAL